MYQNIHIREYSLHLPALHVNISHTLLQGFAGKQVSPYRNSFPYNQWDCFLLYLQVCFLL